MIPPLDNRGLLPPGCHACKDWKELAEHFAINPARVHLLGKAMDFVRNRLTPLAGGLRLIIGGSYLSDKEQPNDVEMVVMIPLCELKYRTDVIDMFGRYGAHGLIHQQYDVDFYINLEGIGGNNLALFFEYVGDKTAAAKGLDAKDKRGTIEIESWTLP